MPSLFDRALSTPAIRDLRVRVVNPLLHRTASAVVELARATLRWAYIGPEDSDRYEFGSFGSGTLIEQPFKVLLGPEHISIGNDSLIAAGAMLAAWPESEEAYADGPILRIGDRVWGARGLSIVAHLDIEIGDDVWFGPGVYVTDAGHDSADLDIPIGLQMEPAQPVRIGAGSWLGTGAVVLPGVTIGEHVVIGANSVVCDDIPANSIAVGSPARVVRHIHGRNSDTSERRETLAALGLGASANGDLH
ncbi:MAG TPA: acyltransferase [Microthrixaceae bacterium]|nr:acyltransferase [Microthrixaceae bacterium]